MPRSEDDKLCQSGIKVMLGGKEYEVRPLVIRESREWRAKVIKLIAPLPEYVKTEIDKTDDFEKVLSMMLVTMPDQVLDLFFDYAKDLNREEIENTATDEELTKAFNEVVKIAFPLVRALPETMTQILPK